MPAPAEPHFPEPSRIEGARRLAALGALLGLVTSSLAWFFRPHRFLLAYGAGLVLWVGVACGCVVLDLLRHRAQRHWLTQAGVVGAAGRRTLPVLGVVALPVVCSFGELARETSAVTVLLLGLVGLGVALTLVLAVLCWLARETPSVLPATEIQPLMRLVLGAWLTGLVALTVAVGLGLVAPVRTWRAISPVDLVAVATLSALWGAYFLWNLDRRPPAPLRPGPTTDHRGDAR